MYTLHHSYIVSISQCEAAADFSSDCSDKNCHHSPFSFDCIRHFKTMANRIAEPAASNMQEVASHSPPLAAIVVHIKVEPAIIIKEQTTKVERKLTAKRRKDYRLLAKHAGLWADIGFRPKTLLHITPTLFVAPSTLGEKAGFGLFARVTFLRDETISRFQGEASSEPGIQDSISLSKNRYLILTARPTDIRSLAQFANTRPGNQNARITADLKSESARLVATKRIMKGGEIFAAYGKTYYRGGKAFIYFLPNSSK